MADVLDYHGNARRPEAPAATGAVAWYWVLFILNGLLTIGCAGLAIYGTSSDKYVPMQVLIAGVPALVLTVPAAALSAAYVAACRRTLTQRSRLLLMCAGAAPLILNVTALAFAFVLPHNQGSGC